MREWKQFYKTQRDLVKRYKEEDPSLRFDKRGVWASEIGSQLFCETSLELDSILGELETEEMRLGTKAHKQFAESFPSATVKEILQTIYSDKISMIMELGLIAWNRDEKVFMSGRPDGMIFRKGIPLLVMELKFNKFNRPFPSYHAQTRFYCSMLHHLGFNTSRLYYTIGMGHKDYSGPKVSQITADRLVRITANPENPPENLKIGKIEFHFFPFNYSEFKKQFHKLIAFWKKEREATPQKNRNKCKGCKRRSNCGRSLI